MARLDIASETKRISKQALDALEMAQDYYLYNKWVWRFLQSSVRKGTTFTIRNLETGKKVNERQLTKRSQFYITVYQTSWTFQHAVAIFETFFFEILQVWLENNPGALSSKQVAFGEILKLEKAKIILTVVEKELNELKYERVVEWFKYLERFKIDCPTADEIGKIAEIKAARDILVHNNGKINGIYLEKAGKHSLHKLDDKLDISERYLRDSTRLLRKIIQGLSDAIVLKATKPEAHSV